MTEKKNIGNQLQFAKLIIKRPGRHFPFRRWLEQQCGWMWRASASVVWFLVRSTSGNESATLLHIDSHGNQWCTGRHGTEYFSSKLEKYRQYRTLVQGKNYADDDWAIKSFIYQYNKTEISVPYETRWLFLCILTRPHIKFSWIQQKLAETSSGFCDTFDRVSLTAAGEPKR